MDLLVDDIYTIYDAIGLNKSGDIIPNGYFKLFNNEAVNVQEDIIKYLLENLNKTSYNTILSDFNKMLLRYSIKNEIILNNYRTYINDLTTRVVRIRELKFALQLDMKYFVYDGTEIPTSRPFCKGGYDYKYRGVFENKIGRVFTIEQAMKWENIDFCGKTKPYNALIDLAGFGCRHMARFITESYAFELMENLEENNIVNKAKFHIR